MQSAMLFVVLVSVESTMTTQPIETEFVAHENLRRSCRTRSWSHWLSGSESAASWKSPNAAVALSEWIVPYCEMNPMSSEKRKMEFWFAAPSPLMNPCSAQSVGELPVMRWIDPLFGPLNIQSSFLWLTSPVILSPSPGQCRLPSRLSGPSSLAER